MTSRHPCRLQKLNIRTGLVLVVFFLLWLHSHPYAGIVHDGRLYLGQALNHIDPDALRSDLFFKYGSQDQFTFFSPIYGWALQNLGISIAPLGLLLIAQCLFIVALLLCCTKLFGTELGLWAGVAVAIFPRYYGGIDGFSYSEMFLTARSLAEPLCLFAVWLLIMGKTVSSMALIATAFFIHPLMSLPCALLWWIYNTLQNKKFLLLGFALPGIPLLGALQIAPFDQILKTYDPVWWDIVTNLDSNAALGMWHSKGWSRFCLDLVLIAYGSSLAENRLRLFLRAAILMALISLMISLVGTDLSKNVLITGLQPWRAHWVLHLFAMAILPYVCVQIWKTAGGAAKPAIIMLVLAACLNSSPVAASIAAIAVGIHYYHQRRHAMPLSTRRLFAASLSLIAIVGIVLQYYALSDEPSMFASVSSPWASWKLAALTYSSFAFPCTALVLAWLAYRSISRKLALSALIALFIPASLMWDQRAPWEVYLEQDVKQDHPFTPYLEKGRDVYWHGKLLGPWVVLGAPSYFAQFQGAGALFNRETAIELKRREEILDPLLFQTAGCETTIRPGEQEDCNPSKAAMHRICTVNSVLDAMILPWKIEGIEYKQWSPSITDSTNEGTFYLYKCESIKI